MLNTSRFGKEHAFPEEIDVETLRSPSSAGVRRLSECLDWEDFCKNLRRATGAFAKQQNELIDAFVEKMQTQQELSLLGLGESPSKLGNDNGNEHGHHAGPFSLGPSATSSRTSRTSRSAGDGVCSADKCEDILNTPSLKCTGLTRVWEQRQARKWYRAVNQNHWSRRFAEKSMLGKFLNMLVEAIEFWDRIEEPPRTGRVASCLTSRSFECICILIIVLNGLFIIETTNFEIQQVLHQDPLDRYDFLLVAEFAFTCFYFLELIARIWVHRVYFFVFGDWKWNIFDSVVVTSSIADMAVQFVSRGSTLYANFTFLRVCRIFKLAKILRMFRAVHFISDLRVMVDSVVGSFCALFWCIVLISLVLYMFALVFVQLLAAVLSEQADAFDQQVRVKISATFGSVQQAMLCLFQATTGGEDWAIFYDVVALTGSAGAALFIFFIAFFVVAAWNIVTSTFVEKAFQIAQPDIELQLLDKRRKDLVDAVELKHLMESLRVGIDDHITMEEFMYLANNERFLDFFHLRGIDFKDTAMFFKMLCSVSDRETVDVSTFVAGCLRMKGIATSIDLHTLSFETKSMVVRLARRVEDLEKERVQVALNRKLAMRQKMSMSLPSLEEDQVTPECSTRSLCAEHDRHQANNDEVVPECTSRAKGLQHDL